MSRQTDDDAVFKALAHPRRRAILDHLKDRPHTTGMLCDAIPEMDRCTVMQHLKVLETSALIIVRRQGRVCWNHLNSLPIKGIHDRWIGEYAQHAVAVLQRMKDGLENEVD